MTKLNLYLGGSIRDKNEYDVWWRKEFWQGLGSKYNILDPTSGRRCYRVTSNNYWAAMQETLQRDTNLMTEIDTFKIERANVGIWNLLAFNEGYPCIGSLVEIGIAWRSHKLVFVISDNVRVYQHPFIARPAAGVFPNHKEAMQFLDEYAEVLSGTRRVEAEQ